MEQLLIPAMTFVAVTSLGGSIALARRLRRQPIDERLEDLDNRSAPEASTAPADGWTRETARAIGQRMSRRSPAALQKDLAKAGFYHRDAAAIYMGIKAIGLLVGSAATALAVLALDLALPMRILLVLLGGGLMFMLPNLLLRGQLKRRCEEIRHQLPYALDLLEICVSSGMGMDMAWNSVADEIRRVSPTLADEMALTTLEIHLGASRAAAMRHMAERTNGEELSSLVTILVQSERFGTSIADALRTFAGSLLEMRKQRAQEMAEKMAIKMVLPMVLFIFPSLLIVMVGPAAITLGRLLGP